MKGVRRRMNALPTRLVCRLASLCFTVLGPLALGCGAGNCRGDEMSEEVAKPLREFKVKRLDIEQEAEAKTKQALTILSSRLERISKGKNKNPKANAEADQLLKRINEPTFLALGLPQLLNETQVGVSLKAAEQIAALYKQRAVTDALWKTFPGDVIVVPAGKRTDTDIDVKQGDIVLMCPHPIQKWREGKAHSWATYDGAGGAPRHAMNASIQNDANIKDQGLKDNVLWQCPQGGRLFFVPGWAPGGEGSIECKVFKIVAQ